MNQTTDGISPKITAVITAIGGPGIILLILGLVFDDPDLRNLGLAGIAAAGVGGAAGYKAKPGNVTGFTSPEDAVESPPFDLHAAHGDPDDDVEPAQGEDVKPAS